METDVPLIRSVEALKKAEIPQNLPKRGDYIIEARHYGGRSFVINMLAGCIQNVLDRFGYKGRVFKEKNHKYATLDEKAVSHLRTACKLFSCED